MVCVRSGDAQFHYSLSNSIPLPTMLFCNFLSTIFWNSLFYMESTLGGLFSSLLSDMARLWVSSFIQRYQQFPNLNVADLLWIVFHIRSLFCFPPVVFFFPIEDKHSLLGYLLWRGGFCKLCTFLTMFYWPVCTKGLQSLWCTKCMSLFFNYWDLKRLEKFASDVDRCLNLLARCWYARCVGLFLSSSCKDVRRK